MKKKMLLISIISFLIGGLLFGSIGVVFAITYKASDIVYSPTDNTWNVTTVGQAINDLALSKTSDNYSTDEQVIGTWIDGKPIYQKTLYYSSSGTTSSINIATISNVKNIIDLTGMVLEKGIYYDIDNYNCRLKFDTSNNTLQWEGANWTSPQGYAVIKYTKTVD